MKVIAIEGLDGLGKHTQSTMLLNYLKGLRDVSLVAFPNDNNEIGQHIRELLNSGEAGDTDPLTMGILYAIDRYVTFQQVNTEFVISDRYTLSNVYQVVRGADLSQLYNFEHEELGLPYPLLTIFLDAEVETAFKLKKNMDTVPDVYEKDIQLQRDVRETYHELLAGMEDSFIVKCDPSGQLRSKTAIHQEIVGIVNDFI